jgi:hypothetical protein
MINLNSVFSTIALRKIAYYTGSFLGNDIYFMKEFVDLMIGAIGEEKIVERLKFDKSQNSKRLNQIGENWFKPNGMKNKLKKFDKIIEKTKLSYDVLEDPTLSKNKEEKKDLKYSDFSIKAMKIPAIKEDFISLFVFLVNSTQLSQMSLKPEDIKVMENKGYKVVDDLDKKRLGDKLSSGRI